MNKNDLVSAVSDTAGISKADATKAVDSVFDNITSSLQGGSEVRLVGFGTFSVSHRKATTGRNPRTGSEVKISRRRAPVFKPSKELRARVETNGNPPGAEKNAVWEEEKAA